MSGNLSYRINHIWLFIAKPLSALYKFIRYIWFGFLVFYAISIIVSNLMLNSFYTYQLNIYDSVC